jgi:alkylation response protein AidB-like acyl-CoA dehydrogenase
MVVSLSSEQKLLVSALRDIAQKEFLDASCTWDGDRPWTNLRTLANADYLGISLPTQYGGGGMTEFEALLMIETIGRVCPDTAYALPDTTAARAIAMFGSETAKETYLPPVTAGDDYIAIAISEPDAGSDVRSMATHVEESDGDLRLSGEKTWVSGVPDASAAVVWTKFPEGLGTVIVEFDQPGVEIGTHFTNMFGHTQTQFFMDDVNIDPENVLVRGADGFTQLLKSLNWERLGNAALSNATAMCAFDKALEYAGERSQFGQPIGDFQGIEWKLADMAKEIQAARAMTFSAGRSAVEAGHVPDRLDTHIANLYAGEMLEQVVSESLQIHGANGFQRGHPLEYLYRFARSRRIAGGTDEIQKNTITKVLKSDGFPGPI